MSCASCAANVESIIKSQSGVMEVSMNFADSFLLIEYNSEYAQPSRALSSVSVVGNNLRLKFKNY